MALPLLSTKVKLFIRKCNSLNPLHLHHTSQLLQRYGFKLINTSHFIFKMHYLNVAEMLGKHKDGDDSFRRYNTFICSKSLI